MKFVLEPGIESILCCHRSFQNFDYHLFVDWAIALIQKGEETENVLVLASFGKQSSYYEMQPYIRSVFQERGLSELHGEEARKAITRFHVSKILMDKDVRDHLRSLRDLAWSSEYAEDLMPFYLLCFGWEELDELAVDLYTGNERHTILEDVKTKSREWILMYG